MNIIHFADFHLGASQEGPMDPTTRLNGRILDYLDTLDALVEYAEDNDADLAVFAGDAFHKNNPDPTLLGLFAERIIRLSKQCPVVIVPGNHDMPGVVEKATSVDIFNIMDLPDIIVGRQYELLDIETKHGMIQVATVPYPLRSQMLPSGKKYDVDKTKRIMRATMRKIIEGLSSHVSKDFPAILVGHFSVDGAEYGVERLFTFGIDADVPLECLLNPIWDYVALGHIHRYQNLSESTIVMMRPPIVYSGSLERVDFSEEGQEKGFVWVEIDGKNVDYEFVVVDARPMKTISISVPDGEYTQYVLSKLEKHNLSGKIVRVRIDVSDSIFIDKSEIYRVLEKMGVYYVHSIRIISPVKARTLSLDTDVPLSSLAPIDLLGMHLEDKGVSGKKLKNLLSLAKDIMSEVDRGY